MAVSRPEPETQVSSFLAHYVPPHLLPVCVSVRAAMTKHRPGWLRKQVYFLTVSKPGSPRSRCLDSPFLVHGWPFSCNMVIGLPSVSVCVLIASHF